MSLKEELILLEDRRVRYLLIRLSTALDDWLHCHAADHCNENKVDESYRRIMDRGGTSFYIATLQKEIRDILKENND